MRDNEKRALSNKLRKLRNKEAYAEGRYRIERIKLKEIREEIAVVLEALGDDA